MIDRETAVQWYKMKPLRWFGYKITEDKIWKQISDSIKQFGIIIHTADLSITDYSRRDQCPKTGFVRLVPRGCTRTVLLNLQATKSGYTKLLNFLRDGGARQMGLISISSGEFPFEIQIETFNDFDSIENFLRINNDHQ